MTQPNSPLAGPTPPAGGPDRPPRRKKWLWITITLIVVALLGSVIGGEVYARASAEDCLTQQFEGALGSKVNVEFSSRPMLWQLLTKDVPYVTVASKDSRFGTSVGMAVRARANNINIERDTKRAGSIGSTLAEVKWPVSGIQATLQNSAVGGLVQEVKTNPADSTLELTLGPGGLGKLTVKPQINNGVVEVTANKASVLGFGIPATVVDGIVKLFTSSLQNYPLGMQAQTLKVTDAGVELRLAGGHYDMPLPNSAPQNSGDSGNNNNSGNNNSAAKPNACAMP